MKIISKTVYLLLILPLVIRPALAQGIKMGEVIVVSTSDLKKDVKPEAIKAYVKEIGSKVKKTNPSVSLQLFQADRGDRKGEQLLVFATTKAADREAFASGSPFADEVFSGSSKRPSDFLTNTHTYTEYRLIGAEKFKSRPDVGILGIHYIKVKKERAAEFEKFVVERLHPAVGDILPEMHLMYYKAVAGDHAGSYITVFGITSVSGRDKYWPAGAPETKVLKDAFKPQEDLAKALGSYLEPGSFLEPKGGAAAYFESKEWTDFVYEP